MIGEKANAEAKKMLALAVDQNWADIKEAYIKAKSRMRVGIGLIFEPDKQGEKIEVRISLVTGRLKNSYESVVNELQDPLIKAVDKLRPKKGSGIDKVTVSSGGKSVSLEAKD